MRRILAYAAALLLLMGHMGCLAETASVQVPYLQKIQQEDQPIFDGPGYEFNNAGMVREAGVYTIVEEKWGAEGHLWGRLKSGAGWVDLTIIRGTDAIKRPITAVFAGNAFIGPCHAYVADASEYMTPILFHARETLRQVRFSSLEWQGASYAEAEVFCTLNRLSPDIPFLLSIVFYGDMTTYGVSFLDESGAQRHYALSVSGKDGELILEEYIPSASLCQ